MGKQIKLTQGFIALVDDADYESLSRHKWCVLKAGRNQYAIRGVGGRKDRKYIYMHREILGDNAAVHTDHVDGNGLNNQRENLRACTHRENLCGQKKQDGRSSKYKGVCLDKKRNKWLSYVKCKRKFINLGYFKEEINAAMAYDKAAKQLFGAFARPNL